MMTHFTGPSIEICIILRRIGVGNQRSIKELLALKVVQVSDVKARFGSVHAPFLVN